MAHGITYKVVDTSDNGVLNHIVRAPNEQDSDSVHIKESKRRAHAVNLANRWMETAFRAAHLAVVPNEAMPQKRRK